MHVCRPSAGWPRAAPVTRFEAMHCKLQAQLQMATYDAPGGPAELAVLQRCGQHAWCLKAASHLHGPSGELYLEPSIHCPNGAAALQHTMHRGSAAVVAPCTHSHGVRMGRATWLATQRRPEAVHNTGDATPWLLQMLERQACPMPAGCRRICRAGGDVAAWHGKRMQSPIQQVCWIEHVSSASLLVMLHSACIVLFCIFHLSFVEAGRTMPAKTSAIASPSAASRFGFGASSGTRCMELTRRLVWSSSAK